MRRTYERGTKARLSLEEVNVGGKKLRKRHVRCAVLRYVLCAKISQILEVLRDFHRLWIQKQSNYRHSPYYPPCLQERVARQRS